MQHAIFSDGKDNHDTQGAPFRMLERSNSFIIKSLLID
jgi:hypothetical protein